MNFDKTDIGRKFFNKQLPKMINLLDKIAESLPGKQISNVVYMDLDLPKNYLEDLYYGNLEIGAYSRENYNKKTNRKIVKVQDHLKDQLTEEQWQLFEKYSLLVNNRESEECFRMFQHGYRTAMRLITAGMQPVSEEPKEK